MKIEYMILDESGKQEWRELGNASFDSDVLQSALDGIEVFELHVSEPIRITRTIELLPVEVAEVPVNSRGRTGKGRKAHKAFQRKLGAGW